MKALVLGGGGFIGTHLIKRLKTMDFHVTSVDLKANEFTSDSADVFVKADLRQVEVLRKLSESQFDWIFQLAADMGGAGYVFSREHDADIMHNSALINLNVLDNFKSKSSTIFYASSACIYPEENQLDPQNPNCAENTAYPANPDSEYGWEKLFSERLFLSFARNYGTDIRIARLHNVYGAFGSFANGREKAPSALCRKVIDAEGNSIDVWGSGNQTRSFLYIDDCIDAIILLMQSKLKQAINIGSEDLISIADLARMIVGISQKNLDLHFVDGPTGVPGRCSDNRMIRAELHWEPKIPLSTGIKNLYNWIEEEMSK